MDIRRILFLNGLFTLAVLLAIVLLFSIFAFSPSKLPASNPFFDDQAKKYNSFLIICIIYLSFSKKGKNKCANIDQFYSHQ